MARDVVALVSGEDFVAAVRAHADRVHDVLRRGGLSAVEALQLTQEQALALLDAVVDAPERVGDLAGWWFAAAYDHVERAPASPAELTLAHRQSLLSGPDERSVRAALAGLGTAVRRAVSLRDAYDLAPSAVAVALRREEAVVTAFTASGRLQLVAEHDHRPVPSLEAHVGRTTVDLSALCRLVDGTLEAPRAAALRRHLLACSACEQVTECLSRGRRLASGLAVAALPDDARDRLIERVAARALERLPSHEEVVRAAELDSAPRSLVSPLVVALLLVLAAALGILLAVATRSSSGSPSGQVLRRVGSAASISATANASSRDWPLLSRGSQAVS